MPNWESPLRIGDVVTCTDGHVVRILSLPWDNHGNWANTYAVKIQFIRGGTPGEIREWIHEAPNRFGSSKFEKIEPDDGWKSLEDEFFERTKACGNPL